MKGQYREIYREYEILVTRPPNGRRWSWLDHRSKEGFGFDTRSEAIFFARQRIDRYASNTVAFIWSIKDQRYLGIDAAQNPARGDFCNDIRATLRPYGAPHAFESVERAQRCLDEDTPWFNSGINMPQRADYNAENCKVIEVELDPSPVTEIKIQQ
jgi:hypothetical protein